MSKVYIIDNQLDDVLWQASHLNCTYEILKMLRSGATIEELRKAIEPHQEKFRRQCEKTRREMEDLAERLTDGAGNEHQDG